MKTKRISTSVKTGDKIQIGQRFGQVGKYVGSLKKIEVNVSVDEFCGYKEYFTTRKLNQLIDCGHIKKIEVMK